jgi:DNA-directed RNA polymerase specialized sigma24 family protein
VFRPNSGPFLDIEKSEAEELAEVGDLLGIAEGTSKSLVHKARMKLRAILDGRS